MIKKIAKMAENCAQKSAKSDCFFTIIFHQPKMPRCLIQKNDNDENKMLKKNK